MTLSIQCHREEGKTVFEYCYWNGLLFVITGFGDKLIITAFVLPYRILNPRPSLIVTYTLVMYAWALHRIWGECMFLAAEYMLTAQVALHRIQVVLLYHFQTSRVNLQQFLVVLKTFLKLFLVVSYFILFLSLTFNFAVKCFYC